MGELVIGRESGGVQRRKPRAHAFTATKRQAFLDALAYSCNVREAARYVGVDSSTLYYHRCRDPRFAEQWREAIWVGYDRIEALVLEHGGGGQALEPGDPERVPEHALAPFDFAKGLAILQHYRRKREGVPIVREGDYRTYATRAETNAALMKALDIVEKQIRREGEDG